MKVLAIAEYEAVARTGLNGIWQINEDSPDH